MPFSKAVDSRVILTRLREALAEPGGGQERLDRIVRLIAGGLVAEVCSVYLRREDQWLELCATEGLKSEAVHLTRLRIGEGLVGRIAETAEPLITRDAPHTRGFRYLPETGEEIYTSFLGVPIQRLGEVQGVLVVQNREPREYTDDEVYALEVVAMVIAEMAELGAFIGPGPMEHRPPAQAARSSRAAWSARRASPRARWCCTSRRSWSASRSATTRRANAPACAPRSRRCAPRSTRCSPPTT